MRKSQVLVTLILALTFSVIGTANGQGIFDATVTDEIETIQMVASGRRYAPRQSISPGGSPQHTSNYEIEVTWNPGEWLAREEKVQQNIYPVQIELPYTMTYGETAGIKEGRDSFGSPVTDERPMAPARIGTNFKDLWLTNPVLLAVQADVLSTADISVGGENLLRVTFAALDTEWHMIIDPATQLPREVVTIESDPHNGRIPNRVVFSNWQDVSGVPFPFQIEQYLGGDLLRREIRSSIEINARNAERQLELPDDLPETDEAMRQWGWQRSHLLLARASLGGPMDVPDIDNVTFDEVGPDIFQVTGSIHHALVVAGPSGIAVVDAPWFPERSEIIMRQIEERWPGLPIRYIILSHHHIDHTGGFRSFVEAGATLVAHADSVPFFEAAMENAGHSNFDSISVADSVSLDGIGRTIGVYELTNAHSDGAVVAYVPDTKLLFNADIYSPGRELQFDWMHDLFDEVRYHGLDVERHVGGHGDGYDAGRD
ncbi:MAG: MBL fold metallo-hydrolase [Gammaproteobacteria bacterium]